MMLRVAMRQISKQGRATQGVRVMSLKNADVVASVAVLAPKAKEVELEDELAVAPPLALAEVAPKPNVNGH
jgi:DNA gyrase/topoisomerase IV subunit A